MVKLSDKEIMESIKMLFEGLDTCFTTTYRLSQPGYSENDITEIVNKYMEWRQKFEFFLVELESPTKETNTAD
jgi:hypothetical protein